MKANSGQTFYQLVDFHLKSVPSAGGFKIFYVQARF
jgi:hypothetical protein